MYCVKSLRFSSLEKIGKKILQTWSTRLKKRIESNLKNQVIKKCKILYPQRKIFLHLKIYGFTRLIICFVFSMNSQLFINSNL